MSTNHTRARVALQTSRYLAPSRCCLVRGQPTLHQTTGAHSTNVKYESSVVLVEQAEIASSITVYGMLAEQKAANASADTSKPASRGRVKTGQSLQDEPSYRGGRQSCKSTCSFVRQLRGPHLSTWAWWRSRSSIAETAAASPSSLPQSSTGRFEVRSVEQRS